MRACMSGKASWRYDSEGIQRVSAGSLGRGEGHDQLSLPYPSMRSFGMVWLSMEKRSCPPPASEPCGCITTTSAFMKNHEGSTYFGWLDYLNFDLINYIWPWQETNTRCVCREYECAAMDRQDLAAGMQGMRLLLLSAAVLGTDAEHSWGSCPF